MAPWCIYISCFERAARYGSGRDSVRGSVGAMNAKLSRPDGLATVQSGRKQAQSRVCTRGFTTVFRHSRLTFQPILQENLESPLLSYQPITTAVVTDACLNARWHHGIYIICLERVARYGSGRDNVRGSVGAMNAELSRSDLLATVQLVRKAAATQCVVI